MITAAQLQRSKLFKQKFSLLCVYLNITSHHIAALSYEQGIIFASFHKIPLHHLIKFNGTHPHT